MSVAHDAATLSSAWTTTPEPFTFDHTPSGTPRGVLVLIVHATTFADLINSVSYGGVAMSRIATAQDNSGEQGRSYVYFLGSGIPTGTQTVSISHTGATPEKIAACCTLTAGEDTEVSAFGILEGDQADPQIALSSGPPALRYCAIFSGLNAPTNLTLLSGQTAIADYDFGIRSARFDRETSESAGSFTTGYTASSDDVAMSSVAVAEVSRIAEFQPSTPEPDPGAPEVSAY